MKHAFTFLFAITISSQVFGQNNYVVNSANSATPGHDNVLIGPKSGTALTQGNYNTFLGVSTGSSATTGGANVFIGYNTGQYNYDGFNNTYVGFNVGIHNISGYQNTFIGSDAGVWNNTSGNTFVGSSSGNLTTGGNGNTFLGSTSGYNNTQGASNVFLGSFAGYGNTFGSNNIFVGYNSGAKNSTGTNNIIIGPNSGTAITNTNDNVLMGYNSQAEEGLYNAIAIGANSRVAVSNALILGNEVNVGIGTSSPAEKLHVHSGQAGISGIRIDQLTSNSPTSLATNQFLTVDQQGNIVKATYQLKIGGASEWSDKVFSTSYSLPELSSVESFIRKNGHLPNVPSAEEVATKGVDLVKMNALLLQKIEELTLYSIQQDKRIRELEKQLPKNK